LIRAKLEIVKHKWDPQTLNSTILNWLQSTVQKTLPESLLLFVEASLLVSAFRKQAVQQKVSFHLNSLKNNKDIVRDWVFQNLSQLWQVSEMSFRYLHPSMYQLTKLLHKEYNEPIWDFLSFCLGPISEAEFKTPVKPSNIRTILQYEIPPKECIVQEGIYQFAEAILKYKLKFETKPNVGN